MKADGALGRVLCGYCRPSGGGKALSAAPAPDCHGSSTLNDTGPVLQEGRVGCQPVTLKPSGLEIVSAHLTWDLFASAPSKAL